MSRTKPTQPVVGKKHPEVLVPLDTAEERARIAALLEKARRERVLLVKAEDEVRFYRPGSWR